MCQAIVLRLNLYLFISYINPLRWAVLLFPFTVEETGSDRPRVTQLVNVLLGLKP